MSIIRDWYEKKLISAIREDMTLLAAFHNLNNAQWHKVISTDATKALANDEQILRVYRWANALKKSGNTKLSPIRVAAEVIICEGLLGLSSAHAIRALHSGKTLDDLREIFARYAQEKQTETPAQWSSREFRTEREIIASLVGTKKL
jgi:hypothetical protein